MAITGQISLARSGENVQIFQKTSDLNDIFDPSSSPVLKKEDHVTLYPGDFTEIDPIEIPQDVYLTILPGARVRYTFRLGELERGNRISERYRDISGSVENIADLHIANQYETSTERSFSRIRLYVKNRDGVESPFIEYNNINQVVKEAQGGETILVFPGEYAATRNLFVNGVNWNFLQGAVVYFDPDWEEDFDSEKYEGDGPAPFSLFDDGVDVNGISQSISKRAKVFGDGKFVIGSGYQNDQGIFEPDPTPVKKNPPQDNSPIIEDGEWEGWHKYSLIALSQNGSELKFEANKIQAEARIDSVIKYSNGSKLDVEAENVVFKSNHAAGDPVKNSISFINSDLSNDEEPPLPAFFLANGAEQNVSDVAEINIKTERFKVEQKSTGGSPNLPHFAVGVNPNGENVFSDNVYLSAEEYEGPVPIEEFAFFTENASANKLVVYNSNISSPVSFAGSNENVIIKNSEIKTAPNVQGNSVNSPIVIAGSGNQTKLSLSDVWLLHGNNGPFTLIDKTLGPEPNFEVKVYKNSFANYPLEKYEKVLHDELNNIAWSQEVDSIR